MSLGTAPPGRPTANRPPAYDPNAGIDHLPLLLLAASGVGGATLAEDRGFPLRDLSRGVLKGLGTGAGAIGGASLGNQLGGPLGGLAGLLGGGYLAHHGSARLLELLGLDSPAERGRGRGRGVLAVPEEARALLKSSSGDPDLDALHQAKFESDRKNYRTKHQILRRLLRAKPHDFHVDTDDGGHFVGVTHRSGYRFHMPRHLISSKIPRRLGKKAEEPWL